MTKGTIRKEISFTIKAIPKLTERVQTMGMAASQARLLSITARLTNNENTGQSISYSKQRLADQTQQITNEYNEALSATKLTVLTGFNGAEATYSDISYNLMTGLQMAENTKQYIVTDTKGRILVTEELANAYKQSSGNYNQFLANLGYSQSDMTVQNTATLSTTDKANAATKLHEAWDKYFATVGINLGDVEHDGYLEEFKWNNTWSTNEQGKYLDKNGNVIDTSGKTADEIAAILQNQGYSFVGSGYTSYLLLNSDGQPIDKDGNVLYKTDANGNILDVNGDPIQKDTYSDDIAKNKNYELRYFDKTTGNLVGFNSYSLDITTNSKYKKGYEQADGSVVTEYDGYSTAVQNNSSNKQRYVDKNGNIIDFDVDSNNDNVKDSYSTTVTSNPDNTLRYVNDKGKIIDYDDFSETTKLGTLGYYYDDGAGNLVKANYDAYSDYTQYNQNYELRYYDKTTGTMVPYDAFSDETKANIQYDESKFVYNPINYEGTTQESRELYDYAMAITEAFMRTEESLTDAQKAQNQYYDLSNYKSASNADNTSALNYYKNIFTKMQTSGYFTYTTTAAKANSDPEHYKYASIGTGTAGNVQKSPLKDNVTFEDALRDGTLRLEYFSSTDKEFVSTTISEDNCIQEVSDERAIAAAESKYNQDMADLENKDKKLDLELKKLDTEHSALQTEYDSVKNVVDKNVENSFKTFG